LSLIRISEQLSAYLTELGLNGADDEQQFLNDKERLSAGSAVLFIDVVT
uniref:Redox-regulated ATPase YchF n=1 Tax=Anisakis simplex TaxID=6269 RepID=A0A0M3J6X6_ANISI